MEGVCRNAGQGKLRGALPPLISPTGIVTFDLTIPKRSQSRSPRAIHRDLVSVSCASLLDLIHDFHLKSCTTLPKLTRLSKQLIKPIPSRTASAGKAAALCAPFGPQTGDSAVSFGRFNPDFESDHLINFSAARPHTQTHDVFAGVADLRRYFNHSQALGVVVVPYLIAIRL